jgi:hypothetical protein
MSKMIRGLFLAVLVVFAGCSQQIRTVKRAPLEPGERVPLTPELKALYRQVAASTSMLEALDGYADIYLNTPKRSAKAYCTIQLQKSRDARLIVTAGILGWPVADLLIRPDSLFVNDMLNNRMLVGRNSGENLSKIIGVNAGFGHVTETLFGMADVSEPESEIESVRQGNGHVSFTVRSGNVTQELVVDSLKKELEGIAYFDFSGRKNVEFRFADYQLQAAQDGTSLKVPKEIDMILYRDEDPEGTRSLKVVYDERVINPPAFTITFKRPARAKTVNLDEVERLPWL